MFATVFPECLIIFCIYDTISSVNSFSLAEFSAYVNKLFNLSKEKKINACMKNVKL